MKDCASLEANSQSLEVVQPGDRSFDNSAGLAKAATARLAPAGDLRGDADDV